MADEIEQKFHKIEPTLWRHISMELGCRLMLEYVTCNEPDMLLYNPTRNSSTNTIDNGFM